MPLLWLCVEIRPELASCKVCFIEKFWCKFWDYLKITKDKNWPYTYDKIVRIWYRRQCLNIAFQNLEQKKETNKVTYGGVLVHCLKRTWCFVQFLVKLSVFNEDLISLWFALNRNLLPTFLLFLIKFLCRF